MPAILLQGKDDALRGSSVQDGRRLRDYMPGFTGLLVSRLHERRSPWKILVTRMNACYLDLHYPKTTETLRERFRFKYPAKIV